MLYFQWRGSSGTPVWLVLCLVSSLVLPEAEFSECSSSPLASGLPAVDCELTSALQVSVEIVRAPAQHQQKQQQQQPVATPALQAQAVTPCLGGNDLRKKDRACDHPPDGTVETTESADRQRASQGPQSQERPTGLTAPPMPSIYNTSSGNKHTLLSASWLSLSASLERAEEVLASTVQSSSGSAMLLIVPFILIVVGVGILLFAGQARGQRQSPARRPALSGNHSTNMGTSRSLMPSTRHLVPDNLPQSAKPSMMATGRQSIGQPQPFSHNATSSMPPTFLPQVSENWKPPGSSSMPPLRSTPWQSSLSPQQLTHTALSSYGLEQRLQLCKPGAAWTHNDLYFTVSTDSLQSIAESDDATGDFDVLRGGGGRPEPLWVVSVLPWGSSPRALVIYDAGNRGELLAACAPSVVNSGSELEIRDQDSRIWGTLSPQGSDTYAVFQGRGRRVLNLIGDEDTGQLTVKLGEEAVAHAAHNGLKKQVEIGVKPQVDPVLMLVCVLAVLIFNPEDQP